MLNKGDNLFIVDLESVSYLTPEAIVKRASDDEKYFKTPFLYLISAYMRNQAIAWADERYAYKDKKRTGAWMIYRFEK